MKDSKGNVIGIHVIVTIKKNKVAPPFRKCELDIHFGKGIVEHEYIFDEVRSFCAAHGPVKRNGVSINVSGTSSWKDLVVSDLTTGEVLKEKKFYKSEFGDLLKDPEYAPFLLEAIDAAYTVDISADAVTVEDGASNDTDDDEEEDEDV